MKKIIMIALVALTISELNISASSLLTQTKTYYQNGGQMLEDGIIYTMPDGVTQYHVNRAGKCSNVDSSSSTAIAYTQGLSVAKQNGLTFENSLRNIDDGAGVNDAMAFESLFFWTIEGNYLSNALYQTKTGLKVNNIKKLDYATTPVDGNVSYDQWEPVYGNNITTTDFLQAMNTVGAGGCSVALDVYIKSTSTGTSSTPENVVFNMLMSTATRTDDAGIIYYWTNCSASTSSSTSSSSALLGYFVFNSKTYYVTGISATAAPYKAANATTPDQQYLS